jgi:DNA repair protein RadA/Sms
MAKSKSVFICQQCNYESARWFGKCPECGSWNSLVETVVSTEQRTRGKGQRERIAGSKPVSLTSVPRATSKRNLTKISELDRVLGGGLVAGQVVLIAGEPGIGKSTLLLQVADRLFTDHKSPTIVLYVSGEESSGQIGVRAQRLGIRNKKIHILEETNIDSVIQQAGEAKQIFLIVDSIQTMMTSDLSGMAGSVGQVRECAFRLVKFAKSTGTPVFIVGHITKEGAVAGPSVLMHIVDTVLWFEGDKMLPVRLLRAVKNRFGPTDEVGIFSMEDKGLTPINTPEKMFLVSDNKTTNGSVSGSVTTSILQGTRCVLVEIQALVVPTKMMFPKRISQGYDLRRFELMLAILTKRCGLPLNDLDCFLNISGGISLKNDPSADLAVCLAVASSLIDKPLSHNSLALGEVGLLGEIREVAYQEKRIREARRLGFTNIISKKEVRYLQGGIKKYLK